MEWNGGTPFRRLKVIDPKSMMDMTIIPDLSPVTLSSSSSEKGNGTKEVKPRKKTMTSAYHRYFEIAPDSKSRKCKFCGQTYSIATATGNLGRHLATRHPGYDKSGERVTNFASEQTATAVITHQPESKIKKSGSEHLNWLIFKWITSSSLPPETLGESRLLNTIKFLSPSTQIWSTEKFQVILDEAYRSMQKDIGTILDQVSSKVSISLDFWTTYEQVRYMSVTCHWVDDSWIFQKVLLDIRRIPYPCGGAEIYEGLIKVLKMYNIDDKVLGCTHDNSESAIHACHTLKEDMEGRKMGMFSYVPCAARMLNMMIEDGLRTIKPVISKVREFVIEMNASSAILDDFMQLTTACHGVWKFPLDISARWNGHYLMLDIVRKASKSMDTVIQKYEGVLGPRFLLSSSERNAVNSIHEFLEPFFKTTENICTSEVPTMGMVLFFVDHISETITACKDSHHYPDWIKSSAKDMAITSQTYNSQVHNVFTYMTSILDPRIKGELIPDSFGSEDNLEEARSHFVGNYSSIHFSSTSKIYGTQDSENGTCVSFAEEIARKKRRANMIVPTDELSQYLSDPLAPMPTDVLEWWKTNNTRYPRLSVMARDFLPVQATSIPPEHVFCGKGDEIEKQRFGLPSTSTQAVLCVKSWTETGFRLKYKSTEIDCDRILESAAEATSDNRRTGSDKKQ